MIDKYDLHDEALLCLSVCERSPLRVRMSTTQKSDYIHAIFERHVKNNINKVCVFGSMHTMSYKLLTLRSNYGSVPIESALRSWCSSWRDLIYLESLAGSHHTNHDFYLLYKCLLSNSVLTINWAYNFTLLHLYSENKSLILEFNLIILTLYGILLFQINQ